MMSMCPSGRASTACGAFLACGASAVFAGLYPRAAGCIACVLLAIFAALNGLAWVFEALEPARRRRIAEASARHMRG